MKNLPIAMIATALTLTACDDPGQEDAGHELQVNVAPDIEDLDVEAGRADLVLVPDVPIVSRVELADDAVVSYIRHSDGSDSMFVVGPAELDLGPVLARAQLSLADTPELSAMALRERSVDLPRLKRIQAAVGDQPDATAAAGRPATDVLADVPREPSTAACNGVAAQAAGNLNYNDGNCTLFATTAAGQSSRWTYHDGVAYGGHVVADTGDHSWDISKENWGVGSFFFLLEDFDVPEGTQAYWFHNSIGNDFNLEVEMTALDSTFSAHYHDVATCHDWYTRVNALGSGAAGGCRIITTASTHFCASANYVGSDPSNIPTGIGWGGDGTSWGC